MATPEQVTASSPSSRVAPFSLTHHSLTFRQYQVELIPESLSLLNASRWVPTQFLLRSVFTVALACQSKAVALYALQNIEVKFKFTNLSIFVSPAPSSLQTMSFHFPHHQAQGYKLIEDDVIKAVSDATLQNLQADRKDTITFLEALVDAGSLKSLDVIRNSLKHIQTK